MTKDEELKWLTNLKNELEEELEEVLAKLSPVRERLNDLRREQIDWDSRSIEHMELTVRATNALNKAGITTIGALVSLTKAQFLKIPNIGKRSYWEVREELRSRYNLTFAKEST